MRKARDSVQFGQQPGHHLARFGRADVDRRHGVPGPSVQIAAAPHDMLADARYCFDHFKAIGEP
jgi:hypothetical protein